MDQLSSGRCIFFFFPSYDIFESGTNISLDSRTWKMYLLSSCNSTQSPSSNSSNAHLAKRARPLPHSHSDDEFDGNLFTQNDSEREFASKAKRLIRFKDDMIEDAMPIHTNKSSGHLFAERDMKTAARNGNVLHEYCMFESEYAVVGLCLDMCPESERAERERKGDLDLYERLNGDSKQTTEFIAVKKYSRTAQRDAHLIRPMPVLHKTINHLLSLLDRSYDDQFLGIYNFLWDRMRAVRMDLRMQHIFNNEAITMLEQMIKLHIIAMHELCEFSKGEGFVEGFDAHLNIEQMNKTSVELFEMYDNYNKKGKHLETEREFRGYYALLKLDRHPGYNVEPQELSLDLSKMSPEMRSTPEVLFARNVTRACRTCNFVAFFKLVRTSSYLQACLMHAHFVKLRTYALASLHSGLQNSQGIPVSHVAMWLGMEKEDISDLLSFHGFVIKNYKEPYMIKEGPFLNSETDYPTKHSKLVHMKRSTTVVEDVSFSFLPAAAAAEKMAEINSVMLETTNCVEIHNVTPIDEEMSDTDYEFLSPPRGDNTQQQQDICEDTPSYEDDLKFYMDQEVDNKIPENVASQNSLLTPAYCYQSICVSFPQISAEGEIPSIEVPEEDDENGGSHTEEESHISSTIVAEVKCGEVENYFSKSGENEALVSDRSDRADGNAKLRSILRLWRNKASNRKELKNRRLLAANEALNFLSLGPPMGKRSEDVDFHSDFTMDDLFFELQKKHDQKPFTTMNLSEIVSGELCRRDPKADFLSWRVALCCSGDRSSALRSWILSILIPDERLDSHSFVSSSPEISIWEKSVHRHDGTGPVRCFSVVKKINPDEPAQVLAGADSLLTTLCKTLPLDLQKTRICSMLASCPSPLPPILILTDLPSASAVLEEVLNLFYGTERILKCRILAISGKAEDHEELSDALRWLAGRASPKPGVRAVKTRDLVMRHLNPELRALSHIDNVSPDRCVRAVNWAVDRSVEEIYSAASLRPLQWPSPELDALFPGADSKTERVFRSLEMCRLPCFPDVREVSKRSFGSARGMDRSLSELRILLAGYLGGVMGTDMAAKEADLLLQKHTVLELCDEGRRHRLVPKWVPIFRRIFNWSLAPLSHFEYGSDVALVVGGLVDPLFGPERGEEACFFEAADPWIEEVAAGMGWKNEEENEGGREEEICGEVVLLSGGEEIEGGYRGGDDEGGVERKSDGADEFNRLLDKCEVMQNIIDQKLSLFF